MSAGPRSLGWRLRHVALCAFGAYLGLAFVTASCLAQDDAADASDSSSDIAPIAPERAPAIEMTWSPTSGVSVGDRVEVTIETTVRDGDDVAIPEQSLAPFELLDSRRTVHDAQGGERRFEMTLSLLILTPGKAALGPIELRVLTSEGVLGSAKTEKQEIAVASVLANEPNADLKPPTDPFSVTQEDYALAWIALALFAIALVVVVTLFLAARWRRRARSSSPPPPPRPADEVALEELEALRTQLPIMLGRGKGAEWTDAISDTLRKLLGARFGFDALESTTDEILRHLRRERIDSAEKNAIASFLRECDLIKFAKASIGLEQGEALLNDAFTLASGSLQSSAPPQEQHASARQPPVEGGA